MEVGLSRATPNIFHSRPITPSNNIAFSLHSDYQMFGIKSMPDLQLVKPQGDAHVFLFAFACINDENGEPALSFGRSMPMEPCRSGFRSSFFQDKIESERFQFPLRCFERISVPQQKESRGADGRPLIPVQKGVVAAKRFHKCGRLAENVRVQIVSAICCLRSRYGRLKKAQVPHTMCAACLVDDS